MLLYCTESLPSGWQTAVNVWLLPVPSLPQGWLDIYRRYFPTLAASEELEVFDTWQLLRFLNVSNSSVENKVTNFLNYFH